MYRIAICDDDKTLREHVLRLLQDICKDYPYTITEFPNGAELTSWFERNGCTFNIVLMDIELGDASGISIAKSINCIAPECQVLFISGYLDFASDVYSAEHVYFIRKDKLEYHLAQAMQKAFTALRHLEQDTLILEQKGQRLILRQSQIYFLERIQRVTEINTADGVKTTYQRFDDLAAELNSLLFIRCHQSFIVNLEHITCFRKDSFLLDCGKQLPISRSCYPSVKNAFLRYSGQLQ